MTVKTFFEKFEVFAAVPNAVEKMRGLTLGLAFTGRLSGVGSQDGGLPIGWDQKTIADLCDSIKVGFACSKSHQAQDGHVHLRTHNISTRGVLNFDLLVRIDPARVDSSKATIRKGDVLFNNTNSQELVGKTALVDRDYDYGFSNHITRLRVNGTAWPPFVAHYLTYLRNNGHFARLSKRWIGQAAINVKALKQQLVPLPPLAEQKLIVAKVNELLTLCDRLEAQQKERETKHAALSRAALARFTEAPTPANLEYLFHDAYAIDPAEVRKAILTLAVQGKLVSQNPDDKPLSQSFADVKFDYRGTLTGWGQASFGDLTEFVTSGSRSWSKFYAKGGAYFVRTQNIKTDELLFDDMAHVALPDKQRSPRAALKQGDILVTITGANVTKAALVTIQPPEAYVSQHIALCRPIHREMSPYLHLCFTSPGSARGKLEVLAHGDKPGLNLDNIRDLSLPIPPLAEQRRIVAKVEQLMKLTDLLRQRISKLRVMGNRMMDAAVAELSGYTTPNMRPPIPEQTSKPLNRKHSEPLMLTTTNLTLKRLRLETVYRSLAPFDCAFHAANEEPDGANPICLVGLNGSGKSNLIEAIAELFCFLELINLPWRKVESKSSRYRENRHRFELEYRIADGGDSHLVRIRKSKLRGAGFYRVLPDGTEMEVGPGSPQLKLLPRRIIGYSSGLNETVSHPFQRTKTIYSEEVRDAAPPEGAPEPDNEMVADTRTLYMDYESNSAIIIANYIFQQPEHLEVFKDFTRVKSVTSFTLHFNRKRAGKSGANSVVRLTSELRSYLRKFAACASQELDESALLHSFKFFLTEETRAKLRAEFKDAETFFMAMYKWSLLNALILSDDQRRVYLSNDITKGALERPPSVPPTDRVFDIKDLKLHLSEPDIEIDYSGLSDGEHQFMQVFGTVLLFSAPGSMFLFDEPESHFNPEWRTKFNLILDRLPNASQQEYIISTHSPYLVSGARESNVYKFVRDGASVSFTPVAFDTYGAPFDQLLKSLFSINTTIDENAREKLEKVIASNSENDMRSAVEDFAESKEKRRLYEAIIRKEKEGR